MVTMATASATATDTAPPAQAARRRLAEIAAEASRTDTPVSRPTVREPNRASRSSSGLAPTSNMAITPRQATMAAIGRPHHAG